MSSTTLPGDWTCASCQNNNFAKRTTCKMCNKERSGGDTRTGSAIALTAVAPTSLGKRPGDWDCKCGELGFALRTECRQCKRSKIDALSASSQIQLPVMPVVDAEPAPVEIICSIDIERAGVALSFGILMIGVCVGLDDGTILAKEAFCWPVTPKREEFDEDTWDNFWCKHTDVLERIKDNALRANPMSAFLTFLVALEDKHGPFGRKHKKKVNFRFCSDNGAYDLGHICMAMAAMGYDCHIQEMFDDYVSVCDPTEQMRAMPRVAVEKIKASCTAPHDHWAVNDATRTYEMMVGVLKWMKERGSQ